MKVDIAILDAAGAIGSNLCNYLVQHTKYQIVAYDSLSSGINSLQKLAAAVNSRSRVQFYPLALNDRAFSKTLDIHQPQFVMGDLSKYSYTEIVELMCHLSVGTSVKKYVLSINYKHPELDKIKAFFKQDPLVVLVVAPTVFGTRASVGDFEVDAFLAATSLKVMEVSPDLQRWLYVKDYYNSMLMMMNFAPGVYELAITSLASQESILQMFRDFVVTGSGVLIEEPTQEQGVVVPSSWGLSKLWEHTFLWYLENKWCR